MFHSKIDAIKALREQGGGFIGDLAAAKKFVEDCMAFGVSEQPHVPQASLGYAEYLLKVPQAELKAIKKAINVLVRAGVQREAAISTVMEAHEAKYRGHGRY